MILLGIQEIALGKMTEYSFEQPCRLQSDKSP